MNLESLIEAYTITAIVMFPILLFIIILLVRDLGKYSKLSDKINGVINFDDSWNPISIVEKPTKSISKYAITGLYFYDNQVVEMAKELLPSKRGELEITDINKIYLEQKNLNVEVLGRGIAWLDTGTFDSLHEAGSFVKTLEHRQGLKLGYPEEIAWGFGWINDLQFENLIKPLEKNNYGKYLKEILGDPI